MLRTETEVDAAATAAERWRQRLLRVLRDPDQPRVVFQPVVDLVRGAVVGYETLSRFDDPEPFSPDQWFAAADELGLGATLQARALAKAIAALPCLPANTFLTVNIDPTLLPDPAVQAALLGVARLDRLILELTEHTPIGDHGAVRGALEQARAAGALVAVDDAGAGYSGLSTLLELRPQMVKLDRGLVADIDRDPAKRALVEMMGEFVGRVDGWIVAEGIERQPELDELVRLGVPLGQGWLLGRPADSWVTNIPAPVSAALDQVVSALEADDCVGSLVQSTPTVSGPDELLGSLLHPGAEAETVVQVDQWDRPLALLTWNLASSGLPPTTDLLRVKSGDDLGVVARRAAARRDDRFAPLVCCDDAGRYLGVVPVDRLLARLARDR